MRFETPINEASLAISIFLSGWINSSSENLLETPVAFEQFDLNNPNLGAILDSIDANYAAQDLQGLEDKRKEEADSFYASIPEKCREFVLALALTKTTDLLFQEVCTNEEKTVEFKEFELSKSRYEALQKLCLLLDWMIWTIARGGDTANIYSILQLVLESLASISTTEISVFWYYMESRNSLLKEHVFDPKITLNRISMLGVCNALTDKYYFRRKGGKLDSYEKDTFNGRFQARVRTFLANLFLFEDLTGLNKYFTIANRVNREPNLGKAKNGDDELLQDILQFYRLLRDPYSYLKNVRMLTKQVESLDRLYAYLLDEESKYARRHPTADINEVRPPKLGEQSANLAKKFNKSVFFPEQYWLAPFEEIQRGQKFDTVKAEDQRVALKQLDSSKHRQLLLLEIYLVASFFIELQASRKKAIIKSTGAPASTKHMTDDSTPELLMKAFLKIKREIPRLCRSWDSQLSFLLQHLSQSEEFWWAWLIYGKDETRKPLLADKTLLSQEILATIEKFENAVPYKTKRYFNTHVTPQLSRKMKVKTGLALLEDSLHGDLSYEERLEELTGKIDQESDAKVKAELVEERTVLRWKNLKLMRGSHWLQFDGLLSPEMLGVEVKKEVEGNKEVENKEVENKEVENKEVENKEDENKEEVDEEMNAEEDEAKNEEKKEEEEKEDEEMTDGTVKEEIPEPVEDAIEKKNPTAEPENTEDSRKRARSPQKEEQPSLKKTKTTHEEES